MFGFEDIRERYFEKSETDTGDKPDSDSFIELHEAYEQRRQESAPPQLSPEELHDQGVEEIRTIETVEIPTLEKYIEELEGELRRELGLELHAVLPHKLDRPGMSETAQHLTDQRNHALAHIEQLRDRVEQIRDSGVHEVIH